MWIGLVAGTTGALSLKGVEQLSRMLCKAMMYQGIAPCCVMSVEIACEDKLPLLYYSQLTLLDASLDIIQDQLSAGGAYGFNIPPDPIFSLVHIKPNNLRVVVDDDVVGEIPDGQDILARFTEVPAQFSSDGRNDAEEYNNEYEVHLVF
ncbi:hypothetical protein KXX06_009905 [Aspergillus fumigatus]|nr:hypothetical protein KXX06_009905 [Aspergillus fumigatus]